MYPKSTVPERRRRAATPYGPPGEGRVTRSARHGGWRAAIVAGCLLALVSSVTGFPPTSAFGAALESDGSPTVEDPTAPGDGSTTTTSSTLLSGVPETGTPLDPVLDDTAKTVDDLLDGVDEDEALPRLSEDEEPPPDPDPEDEEEEEETSEEDDDDEPKREPKDDPPEEPAEEPPARVAANLTTLRTIDLSAAVPIVSVDAPLGRLPFNGFVDIPLGPRTTKDVIDLLGSIGASDQKVAEVLTPFPVAGPAKYSNDWHAPRHTPYFHPHLGTDIFAPRGTPIVSPTDGVVQNVRVETAIGGNSLRVVGPSGDFFYFAHLDGFAPGIDDGRLVDAGTVLGYVGDSGNALGTPPHLHFEAHPGGGEATPPLPLLDQWLADARAEAQQMAGIEPQPAPQAAQGYSPFVQPQAGVFEPAASHRDSPAATVALLLVIAALVVVHRRRRRVVAWAKPIVTRVTPERLQRRRARPNHLLTLPWELPEDEAGDERAPRDVLAPLLRERETERERVDAGR